MSIREYLHGLDGEHKNANACEYCNADMEIKNESVGMFAMTVKHEDLCPLWQVIQATRK